MIRNTLVLLSALCAAAVHAEPCTENFTSEGNMLVGKTFKTWADLSGVDRGAAFARAQAFTAENGFAILSADASAGVISAAQSVSYGKGKSAPLSVTVRPASGALRVSMSYATSGGTFSPEDAVKRHFCLTLAAMAQATADAPDGVAAPAAAPPSMVRAPAVLPGFAAPTAEQSQAVSALIPKNVPNEKVGALVSEATPTISEFVGKVACMADYRAATSLNGLAAPGVNLGNSYIMLFPMRAAKYHSKAACMSVTRVHGWKLPAANALQFEVVYKADDSGEVAKLGHEIVRQPDGTWLFTQ